MMISSHFNEVPFSAEEIFLNDVATSASDVVSPSSFSHVIGDDMSIEGLGRFIVKNDIRNILVLLGAGVSVAAGIPDFRSSKTGLYSNLEKYNLESPMDAFSISLLRENPSIFYSIAAEMNLWPGGYRPTFVHHFVRLLEKEGRLLRVCTQNIDGLEEEAGISSERMVQAHGNFRHAACIDCGAPFDIEKHREDVMNHKISRCSLCEGVVKPNVIFFGETLPDEFFVMVEHDVKKAELILIIGTSLQVQPVAMLPFLVLPHVPRALINAERVGGSGFRFQTDSIDEREVEKKDEGVEETHLPSDDLSPPVPWKEHRSDSGSAESTRSRSNSSLASSSSSDGFIQYMDHHHHPSVLRDLFYPGDCQEVIKGLCAGMGLLDKLYASAQ